MTAVSNPNRNPPKAATIVLFIKHELSFIGHSLRRERVMTVSPKVGSRPERGIIGVSDFPIPPSYAANRTAVAARGFGLPEAFLRFGIERSSWFHCQRSECAGSSRRISGILGRSGQTLSVTPITSCPAAFNSAAVTELSTPPDIPTITFAIRPRLWGICAEVRVGVDKLASPALRASPGGGALRRHQNLG